MKAITARRDWLTLTSRMARHMIERTFLNFKNTVAVPVSEPATETAQTTNGRGDFYSNQFIVLYGIQPSWDTQRIVEGLRDLKLCFGPYSKVIVCSESYVDDLVHHSDDFNYDAYLLTCDGRDELKNAVRTLQAGKWYLSRSVIASYCVTRRREWTY